MVDYSNAGDTLSMGSFIHLLENAVAKATDDATICFDFCGAVPTIWGSWRGVYSELALGWVTPEHPHFEEKRLSRFLSETHRALSLFHDGYKGGGCAPSLDTPVWADNWGCYTSTRIHGLRGYKNAYGLYWSIQIVTCGNPEMEKIGW